MQKLAVSVLLLLQAWLVVADDHASSAINLNAETFSVDLKLPHFVMFFAPWCGHCKILAPTWEDLATKYNEKEEAEVVIGKVDCTVETALCSDHDVTGYPTLKFFKEGFMEGVKYRGPRDQNSLQNFINQQLGKVDQEPEKEAEEEEDLEIPEPVDGLVELTDKTFHEHVEYGQHFVTFYAPWCGHCQKLAPTWDALARSLEEDQSVSIAKLDCTQYRTVCNEFDVKGYPTLLWIRDGKKVEKYQGSRTHEDLKEFVSRMMTTVDEGKMSGDGKVPDRSSSPVVILTSANFANGIASGVSFVKFFAPWCGHCKRMAPTWEELGGKFADSPVVKVVKVDCTLDINKSLCNEQGVDGFPTLFLYRDGEKLEEYNGSRSLDDLHEFVHKHLRHDEL